MKTLLLIATLAALATSARAASTQTETEAVALPACVVVAPREQPLEQRINASLAELQQQAKAAITAELVAITQQAQDQTIAFASRLAHAVGVAKL